MTQPEKGVVSTMEGPRAAKVKVPTRGDYVTENLLVPEHVGTLKIDDPIVFIEFDDLSGVILCKAEG